MARSRIPLAKAEVSGAIAKNAGRFAGRKKVVGARAVGKPYVAMSEVEKRYWEEFVGDLPWLNAGHRVLLRLACSLAARMDAGEEMGVTAAQALSSVLSKLGATPVDECKVGYSGEEDSDPSEEFFRRPN